MRTHLRFTLSRDPSGHSHSITIDIPQLARSPMCSRLPTPASHPHTSLPVPVWSASAMSPPARACGPCPLVLSSVFTPTPVMYMFFAATASAAVLEPPRIIDGVRLRQVHSTHALPWVFEADWEASSSPDGLAHHDPLASCFWPASRPLASTVAHLSKIIGPCSFIELGCGTGLCSLTAAQYGATSVLATDVSSVALQYTEAAAAAQGFSQVMTRVFDVTSDAPLPAADVLLLSDVFVTPRLADAFARRAAEALRANFAHVLVVDPGRSTRATFVSALTACGVTEDLQFVDESEAARRAQEGRRLLLLDTSEGAPVTYCI